MIYIAIVEIATSENPWKVERASVKKLLSSATKRQKQRRLWVSHVVSAIFVPPFLNFEKISRRIKTIFPTEKESWEKWSEWIWWKINFSAPHFNLTVRRKNFYTFFSFSSGVEEIAISFHSVTLEKEKRCRKQLHKIPSLVCCVVVVSSSRPPEIRKEKLWDKNISILNFNFFLFRAFYTTNCTSN